MEKEVITTVARGFGLSASAGFRQIISWARRGLPECILSN